jgi:undecaprenyl pyrophosphate phosphatase UppP
MAAVVGVPLGLIAGRLLWSSVEDATSVVSSPVYGIGVAIASVAAVAVIAQLVTLIETRRGTHPSTAELLRVE